MLAKTRGIVVRNTNFKDNSVICQVFTQDYGMQSFMLHGVRNQKGAVRPSHIMPLNLLDLVVYKKETSNIQQIKELRCTPPLTSIHFQVLKNSIALFVAETIHATISEEEENGELFQFLENFIRMLDLEDKATGNYPIFFLVHLTRYLGFYPKGAYKEGQIFDLNEGLFLDNTFGVGECMNTKDSRALWEIVHTSTEKLTSLHIARETRSALMDQLLRYYEIHALHGRKIKSHLILREVLS